MRDVDLTVKDFAGLQSPRQLMEHEWAPCRNGCPVHADVRSYIEAISRGSWQEAIDIIRERLPYAAVCGRICHHPCEANCRREGVDKPVAIREVKRFVAELQGASGATVHKAAVQDKAKVAIIGSGPSGLSAALDLAKFGYRPTVFEKFDVAGGIPMTAIPKYRLPRDVIQMDVDWICAHGVELACGIEIGKDKSVADLKAEGFEAVLIAAGLAKSRLLPLPGSDNEKHFAVLDFLTDIAFDRPVSIGNDVVVIGAGNVAMDAARSAVRLGADRVRCVCLENEEEVPAWEWEVEEAVEEGVGFVHRRGPVEIVTEGDRIIALKTRKVTRVFDADGRFSPEYDDSDVLDIECDTVIMAIGQMADTGFVAGSELKLDDRGRLEFNAATQQTNLPYVFACGEIVTPPGSVVEACASGQRAAAAVDMYLTGKDVAIDDSLPVVIDEIASDTAEKVIKVERAVVPTEPGEKRRSNFDEVDHNLDMAAAMQEARRCMNCGAGAEVIVDKCAACLTCLRVCPFDIPIVTDVARIESCLCQACGICISECPANAIIARGHEMNDLQASTAEVLSGGSKVVAYISGQYASADDWQGNVDGVEGVGEIYVPSVSRISVSDILKAFENGAAGVVVVACKRGTERYPTAAGRIEKRVEQAREMLEEIGLNPEKIQFCEAASGGREVVATALTEAAGKIAAD